MSETKTQNNLLIPLILNGKYYKIKQPLKTQDEKSKAECDLSNAVASRAYFFGAIAPNNFMWVGNIIRW